MAFLFASLLLDLLFVVVSLLVVLYLYFKTTYSFWKKKGIHSLEGSFPFGNLGDAMCVKKPVGLVYADVYTKLQGHAVGGFYQLHRPSLLIRDPAIVKSVLIKDFGQFHDRGIYNDEENDPISGHLFLMNGVKWKNLRAKLTPTFTSGKMKMMFKTILACGDELADCVAKEAEGGNIVDIKDWIARYSSDVIATCAFGIQSNCLQNPDSEFRVRGKQILHPGFVTTIGFFLNFMTPTIASIVKLGGIPKPVSDFFRKIVRETVEYREKNDITRNDLMHLMIQLKNKGYVEDDEFEATNHVIHSPDTETLKKMTVDEIAAQSFVFFVAGFETSSTTVSFCLYELAVNPDIQTRLRTENDKVLSKHGGQLSYEAMQDMAYLDMVVDETLRKYPPLPMLNRECNASFTLPDSGVVIEPGTPVVIPVYGLHHDPQYYPDPERFDPERFTPEMKSSRNHYTYLPFGEGPRICIGMRFAFMQTKVALISLLSQYEFKVSDKTPTPLVLDPMSFTLAPKGGMFLKIFNRT